MRIHHLAAAALLGAAALGLSGCATGFPTKVTRYSVALAPGQSFYVVPARGLESGLEFNRYASIVTQQLQARGFQPAATTAAADMLVRVGYGVDGGTQEIESDPFPYAYPYYGGFYGRPYWSRFGYYGGWGSPYYWGWNDPFWYGGGIHSYTVYKSRLDLNIVRRLDNVSLFEGKAVARSGTDELGVLVPNLIEAMFTDFPGHNGETVKITIPPRRA